MRASGVFELIARIRVSCKAWMNEEGKKRSASWTKNENLRWSMLSWETLTQQRLSAALAERAGAVGLDNLEFTEIHVYYSLPR